MKKKLSGAQRLRVTIARIIILYVVMIIAIVGILSVTIMMRCEDYMTKETVNLISANSRQLELNINSYLEKIEKNVALMFANEDFYLYDATDEKNEEYDRIQIESQIGNRIVDLGLMENYADFCIVYSDDHTVGWVSKMTSNMFADSSMYQHLSAYIVNEKTMDAWCFGVCDNYDRMYYVKRLNDNAILVASFYSNELDHVFQYPEEIRGMTVKLVSEDGKIIFSSNKYEISDYISEEQRKCLEQSGSTSAVLEKELLVANTCQNGWVVLCDVSVDEVMKDFQNLKQFAHIIAFVLIIVSVVMCIVIIKQVSKPMGGIVQNLYQKASFDALSGVMNKASFETSAKDVIKNCDDRQFGMMMLDMDNFKSINDTLGHAYGDEVIRRMGKILRNNFHSDSIMVGRMGGDEFAIFYFFKADDENAKEIEIKKIINKIKYLMDEFDLEFVEEKKKMDISLSIGISSTFDTEKDFEALYKAADEALYVSKNNGKAQYNFYQKEAE